MESIHSQMDGQIHKCSLCDFEMRDTTKFNSHLKSHKYYHCAGCENDFHGAGGKGQLISECLLDFFKIFQNTNGIISV